MLQPQLLRLLDSRAWYVLAGNTLQTCRLQTVPRREAGQHLVDWDSACGQPASAAPGCEYHPNHEIADGAATGQYAPRGCHAPQMERTSTDGLGRPRGGCGAAKSAPRRELTQRFAGGETEGETREALGVGPRRRPPLVDIWWRHRPRTPPQRTTIIGRPAAPYTLASYSRGPRPRPWNRVDDAARYRPAGRQSDVHNGAPGPPPPRGLRERPHVERNGTEQGAARAPRGEARAPRCVRA
jgi:hypothetical protein